MLKEVFGFDGFRAMQAEVIENVLHKQDTLVVMPTGSGKSLCYQLPALLFPGLTVVVSPLISLMLDQVQQLQALKIAAASLNSSLDYPEYRQTVHRIRAGAVRLLYVAPETLLRSEILTLLSQCPVDCLTIDEAHCISEWGHDFRPEYRQLITVRQRLATAVCIAVTATATRHVRQDIKHSLAIADTNEFTAGFDRENLYLAVESKSNGLAQTRAFLEAHQDQAGIIYCATRRQVEQLTAQLVLHGHSVLPYHAGLDDETRKRNQHRFTYSEAQVMVATVAFGMGINKPNVRFILHYNLPKNLESYYQQIGRAGRDGLPADCLLLYSHSDVQTINYFIAQQDPLQQKGARIRLEAMRGFGETNLCRRQPLLRYFGEPYAGESCRHCDNCTQETKELVDLTIPAQKFLSCVKRTGEFFGANYIIDVLHGSRAQKILQRGHDKLSTYNIGGEYSKKEWQFLARQFIQHYLLLQDMEHGSLKLTEKAYAVFKGKRFWGIGPVQPPRLEVRLPEAVDYDQALFGRLRNKRAALAAAQQIPPYVIFSDRTLVEMATYFPQSRESLAMLHGVGKAKLDQYADAFLPIIQACCQAQRRVEKRKTATASNFSNVSSQPKRMLEVLDRYRNGQTVPAIAVALGVKQGTVFAYLWKAVQAGEALPPGDHLLACSQLSPAEQQRVFDTFATLGLARLRPVYDALGETVGYDELHLLRLYATSCPSDAS